jgi:hypothetical protein
VVCKQLRSIAVVLTLLVLGSSAAAAQGNERRIPGCGAAVCDEAQIYVAALDTLVRQNTSCNRTAPAVLQTLHLAPHPSGFAFGARPDDRREGFGVPAAPAVSQLGDVEAEFMRRYWDAVRIVTAEEVVSSAIPPGTCLYAFSPVTWLTENRIRLVVLESVEGSPPRVPPAIFAQIFLFLERRWGRWYVSRLEYGSRS